MDFTKPIFIDLKLHYKFYFDTLHKISPEQRQKCVKDGCKFIYPLKSRLTSSKPIFMKPIPKVKFNLQQATKAQR
jgi:hypothetical protein